MKNPQAKTRPDNKPYEVWTTNPMLWEQLSNIEDLKARAGAMTDHGAWTWLVLKKWQADDNKAFARWFCRVMTPIVPQGELGDVYVDDIRNSAVRVLRNG